MPSPILSLSCWLAIRPRYVLLVLTKLVGTKSMQIPYNVDLAQLTRFLTFAIIACPPNVIWQTFLENTFPGYTAPNSPGTLDEKTNQEISEKTAEFTKPLEEKIEATSSAINDNETVKELKRRATSGLNAAKTTVNEIDEMAQKAASNMNLPGMKKDGQAITSNPGPGNVSKTDTTSSKRLNVRNTAIKFALDQTIGAVFNTVLFIAGMGLLKGQSFALVTEAVKRDTLTLIFAGQKLWPAVSIISFTLVPLEYRTAFGGIVGIFWGIYLSLFMGGK